MIDISKPNEWQWVDPANGLVFPWYTRPFLEDLLTWDLDGKRVFEYGMGASTLWWIARGAKLESVDSSYEYIFAVYQALAARREPGPYALMKGETMEEYVNKPHGRYDIIIVDGEYRDECIAKAYESCDILIVDNWIQPSVDWMPSEKTQYLLGEPTGCYPQPSHPDWKTAYWKII
jgi:hypothetical protein